MRERDKKKKIAGGSVVKKELSDKGIKVKKGKKEEWRKGNAPEQRKMMRERKGSE